MFMLGVCKRLSTSQRGGAMAPSLALLLVLGSLVSTYTPSRVSPRSSISWRWRRRMRSLPEVHLALGGRTPHRGCHLTHREVSGGVEAWCRYLPAHQGHAVRVVAIRGNSNLNAMTLYVNNNTDNSNSIQNYLRSPLSPSCTLPLGLLLFLTSDT